jgi:phage I-like protein
MGGGRRASESSTLTGEETAMARSLGLTAQQYLEQKTKMNRLKVSGAIQQ